MVGNKKKKASILYYLEKEGVNKKPLPGPEQLAKIASFGLSLSGRVVWLMEKLADEVQSKEIAQAKPPQTNLPQANPTINPNNQLDPTKKLEDQIRVPSATPKVSPKIQQSQLQPRPKTQDPFIEHMEGILQNLGRFSQIKKDIEKDLRHVLPTPLDQRLLIMWAHANKLVKLKEELEKDLKSTGPITQEKKNLYNKHLNKVLEELGKFNKAREDFERVLKFAPKKTSQPSTQ